jgi:hypothetical protein
MGSWDNMVEKSESRNRNPTTQIAVAIVTPPQTVPGTHGSRRPTRGREIGVVTLWILRTKSYEQEVTEGEACESLAPRECNAAELRGFSSLARFPP